MVKTKAMEAMHTKKSRVFFAHCGSELLPYSLAQSGLYVIFQDLEESYQKFQSRIKHMELDLYPTLAASASMDSQLPNQSLLAQSALD